MGKDRMTGWERGRTLLTGLIVWGLALPSPVALAQLADVDPVLNAGVEALVASDPTVMRDPELAILIREVAEGCVLDPRARAAVTQEVAIIQREGIDVSTVIPQVVRETTRTQYNEWQGRTQAELEALRTTDPELAKERELMLREGERQMKAFESGERYTPSSEMITHANEMFSDWKETMIAQGAPPEFVRSAEFEFARWSTSGNEMGGFRGYAGGGPYEGRGSNMPGYDTGAAKELANKLGVDSNLNLNDPSVIDKLMRDGKLNQETLAKAMAEMGQAGTMDGRLGEMARTYFEGSGMGSMGGRGYTQVDGSTTSLVEAMTKSGTISEARARELMTGGNIFDPNSSEWQALSPEEKAAAASMSQRAAEAFAYEQAGGDKSGWRSGYTGGENYGINPGTGGWEPHMGGTTYTGGTSYAGGFESTYSGGPASTGSWEGSNYGINPSTGGWEPNMGGTTYTGGWESTSYSSTGTASTGETWTQDSSGSWVSSSGETWQPAGTDYSSTGWTAGDTTTTSTSTELQQDIQSNSQTLAQERYETTIHVHEDTTSHEHTIHVHTDSTRHDHTATSPADTAPNSVFQ
ncbi:MAG: hypothetical protein HYU33_02680 [Candidatus Omnitrophica bacterium]|nr:hypothetical protein [Candidatus Omnitrophota bacterium]